MVARPLNGEDGKLSDWRPGAAKELEMSEVEIKGEANESDTSRQTKKVGSGERAQDVAELKDYVCRLKAPFSRSPQSYI